MRKNVVNDFTNNSIEKSIQIIAIQESRKNLETEKQVKGTKYTYK